MKFEQYLKDKLKNKTLKAGIVLGSGLNDLVDSMDVRLRISYNEIPDFPRSTVSGHEGAFVYGYLAGVPVLAAKGRFHYYEGYDLDQVLAIVKSFAVLGIAEVIITNAAGLMNKDHQPGDILLIRDCIDMTGLSASLQKGTEKIRETEKCKAYAASKDSGLKLGEGVYVWTTGPSFETPAEIEFFTSLGGDLVGMSTMPEIMWARAQGMSVYPFSCATNWASGISGQPLTHEEVSGTAKHVKEDLTRYVVTLCKLIGE